MKSVILSRPCSMFLRLSMTCLISAALSLQTGPGAVNSIQAKSLEPKAKFDSGPVADPEPTTPMPVSDFQPVIGLEVRLSLRCHQRRRRA